MDRLRATAVFLALLSPVYAASPAQAFFHLWTISELFSNIDGSVQFIELVSSGGAETQAQNAQIRTTSGGNVFTFPNNLTGNTFNRRLLIATPGFSSLPGAVTPDFTLPVTNFLNPAGDTVRLFHPALGEFHSRTFASVPTNGVLSLNYPPAAGIQSTNSPTNYAGASGSVNVSAPSPTGDYNGNGVVDAADFVVWRKTLNQSASPAGSGADGNASGTIDAGDYSFWRERFGNPVPSLGQAAAPSIAPEPTSAALMLISLLGVASAAPRWCLSSARAE